MYNGYTKDKMSDKQTNDGTVITNSLSSKDEVDLRGLEQFFKDMLKKCIHYCRENEIITDNMSVSVNLMERVPVNVMMEHVLTLEEYIIPKDKQLNEEILRFMTYGLIQNISPQAYDGNEDADIINVRLSMKSYEVVHKVYRYFECCHRIASSHKKILMQCVRSKFL